MFFANMQENHKQQVEDILYEDNKKILINSSRFIFESVCLCMVQADRQSSGRTAALSTWH